VLYEEGNRRSLEGQRRDEIRAALAAAATSAFDLLEPSLGGYLIRPQPAPGDGAATPGGAGQAR
jgi:hypothetical protein